MQCDHFDAGRCRSCTLMGMPILEQVERKTSRSVSLLGPGPDWLPAASGPESGFRTKAKMVIGGTVDAPTLGILAADRTGIDLRDCGVLSPGLQAAMPAIAAFITVAGITPYDVAARRGEGKHAIITESPDGELMLRFVLR